MVPRRGFDEPSLTNRRSFDEVARVASRQRASLEAAQFGGSSRWAALARPALRQCVCIHAHACVVHPIRAVHARTCTYMHAGGTSLVRPSARWASVTSVTAVKKRA